jgi:hypothetical protein
VTKAKCPVVDVCADTRQWGNGSGSRLVGSASSEAIALETPDPLASAVVIEAARRRARRFGRNWGNQK